MNTYKLVKAGHRKRCVFTKHGLSLLNSVNPETIPIFLTVLTRAFRELGIDSFYDPDQMAALALAESAVKMNLEQSLCLRYITASARLLDQGFEGCLKTLDFGVKALLSFQPEGTNQ